MSFLSFPTLIPSPLFNAEFMMRDLCGGGVGAFKSRLNKRISDFFFFLPFG